MLGAEGESPPARAVGGDRVAIYAGGGAVALRTVAGGICSAGRNQASWPIVSVVRSERRRAVVKSELRRFFVTANEIPVAGSA